MITVGAAFPYLLQSVMILALCFLWVAALLDLRSHMRTGVTSQKVLVFIAISISVLAVFLEAILFKKTLIVRRMMTA